MGGIKVVIGGFVRFWVVVRRVVCMDRLTPV